MTRVCQSGIWALHTVRLPRKHVEPSCGQVAFPYAETHVQSAIRFTKDPRYIQAQLTAENQLRSPRERKCVRHSGTTGTAPVPQ
jgi:hypothetical protein